MRSRLGKRKLSCRQQGYALLMVMFIAALILAAVAAADPSILTQGKREKEEEMIWRGKQYVRGIKLYYRKFGRFPTSIDDLTKPKTGSLRFMRQAYKDPMNKEDGSWRLIYVGAAGQLIGSLKPPQTISIPGAAGSLPGTSASTLAAGSISQPGAIPGQSAAASQPGSANSSAPATAGAAAASTNTQQNPPAPGNQDDSSGNLPPSAQADTPTIVGGNIIGVGSKISARSVIVYNDAKNYRLFEFIWDPSKDVVAVGQQGLQIGSPNAPGQNQVPGQNPAPGQNPFGMQPVQNPTNPPAQNPNPNPPPQK
jgi:hypothetical protein